MNSFKFFPLVGFLALFLVSPAFAQEPTNTPPYSPASAASNTGDVLAPSSSLPAPAPSGKLDFLKADNGRFYVALSAGSIHNGDRKSTIIRTSDAGSFVTDGIIESNPGLSLGGKVGVRANDQLAFELETNYTKFNGTAYSGGEIPGSGSAVRTRHIQFINFANVIINPMRGHALSLDARDGTTIFKIEPILIAGVGFVQESLHFPSFHYSLEKRGFAGNLGAGIEAKYGEMFAIGLQYRYILLNNDMAFSSRPDEMGRVDNIKVGRNNAHMMTAQASLRF